MDPSGNWLDIPSDHIMNYVLKLCLKTSKTTLRVGVLTDSYSNILITFICHHSDFTKVARTSFSSHSWMSRSNMLKGEWSERLLESQKIPGQQRWRQGETAVGLWCMKLLQGCRNRSDRVRLRWTVSAFRWAVAVSAMRPSVLNSCQAYRIVLPGQQVLAMLKLLHTPHTHRIPCQLLFESFTSRHIICVYSFSDHHIFHFWPCKYFWYWANLLPCQCSLACGEVPSKTIRGRNADKLLLCHLASKWPGVRPFHSFIWNLSVGVYVKRFGVQMKGLAVCRYVCISLLAPTLALKLSTLLGGPQMCWFGWKAVSFLATSAASCRLPCSTP